MEYWADTTCLNLMEFYVKKLILAAPFERLDIAQLQFIRLRFSMLNRNVKTISGSNF